MLIALGCAAVCLLVCMPLYMRYKTQRLSLAVCFKSLGTLCALVPALIGALKLSPLCWFCVTAVAIHAAADAVLEYRFVHGMGLFLLGHLCYIVFFLKRFPALSAGPILICFGMLAACFGVLLWKHRKAVGKNVPAFAVYAGVLCAMTACGAAGGLASYTSGGMLVAAGTALFCFSDGMIFRSLLYPSPRSLDWVVLTTYSAAQLLLGASCLLM